MSTQDLFMLHATARMDRSLLVLEQMERFFKSFFRLLMLGVQVVLFDGTEGTKQGELVDENCKESAHSGSVFGLCWSPCGQKLATASGDKTVKIWNVSSRSLEK